MDATDKEGVRNFKDFLLQYNKMTEHCFVRCASNFNYRDLTDNELQCIEACSNKALNINQKIMRTFMVQQAKRQEAMVEEFTKQQEQLSKTQIEAAAGTEPLDGAAETLQSSNVGGNEKETANGAVAPQSGTL